MPLSFIRWLKNITANLQSRRRPKPLLAARKVRARRLTLERLEERLTPTAPVLPDLSPQLLAAVTKSVKFNLGATDADGDQLSYSILAAGSEAYFLDRDLVLASSARPATVRVGTEVWFQGPGGKFFLTEDGDFSQWDNAPVLAGEVVPGGELLATLPPVYHAYPDLLSKATPQDLAYVLDRRLGLAPTNSPAKGSEGLDEKWFRSSNAKVKFYLTPEGGLYRKDSTKGAPTTAWMADLSPAYYAKPGLLYAAAANRFGATISTAGDVTVKAKPGYAGDFVVQVAVGDGQNTTKQLIEIGQPGDAGPHAPRVTGAFAGSNLLVVVSFSRPMNDAAIVADNYQITQPDGASGNTHLTIVSAAFASDDRTSVVLTTLSQSEASYTVTVAQVKDLDGRALAMPAPADVDPTRATFTGKAPSGPVDYDQDGLLDSQEQRGWLVTVKLTGTRSVLQANGTVVSVQNEMTRWVTSNPHDADTDADGVPDGLEYNAATDPRHPDTDGDTLSDSQESNEVSSDPTNRDSDQDGLDDGAEFTFFHTAPFWADTDGDQMSDGDEILSNRNPRVSDLPRPEITVGAVNLQLDVRFTETRDQQKRDLETRAVTTSLESSTSQTHAVSHTANVEAHLESGSEPGDGGRGLAFSNFGLSAGYTFQQSNESASESHRAYENSLSTDKEVTQGFNVERSVEGAVMQVAVNLRNVSNLAYRVQNLQVTAFLQDPLDRSKLTPVATLLPESEPDDGFTLGPLVTNRGPFIFSASTIVPRLVESLMANSSGLVFRISNYDVVDEAGRNFAFTSQQVVERTAQLVIDFGGARSLRARVSGDPIDENQPGDETEIHRVATSAGRLFIDANNDGTIDRAPREVFDAQGNSLGVDVNGDGLALPNDDLYARFFADRTVIFDASAREVGISVHQAFAALGLTRYDEAVTPTANLTEGEVLGSYSTIVVGGREKVYRIRGVANDSINQKFWEVLTPTGVDATIHLEDLILKAGSGVSLNFVQDLDGDGLTADVEFFLHTSDSPVGTQTLTPDSTDPFNDAVGFFSGQFDPGLASGSIVHVSETGGGLQAGVAYFIGRILASGDFYSFYRTQAAAISHASQGQLDLTGQRVDITGDVTAAIQFGTPRGRDTDRDGLDDRFESLIGWTVDTPQRRYQVFSSPTRADSNFDSPKADVDSDGDGTQDRFEYDGSDLAAAPAGWDDRNSNGLRDRFEVSQTGPSDYVLDPIRLDLDGDGISDATEVIGFQIIRITDGSTFTRSTNPLNPDTDGDTFADGFEKSVGLDPTNGNDVDSDGDGLPDPVETAGWLVTTFVVSTIPYQQNPGPIFVNVTETDFDYVTFYDNASFLSGFKVQTAFTGGGLTAGRDYYLGRRDQGTLGYYSFYSSQSDAIAATNTGVIDLTSRINYLFSPNSSMKTSRNDSADSDNDGLTDFEEFFLKTDPSAADSDADGVNDLLEVRGYRLGHEVDGKDLGLIKTNPLDADTDNDKRSDGAEAELQDVELARWIVRVVGEAPRQVFSNPLVADADFDGRVDGDEFAYFKTDPNHGNTDGDARDDGQEFVARTNPLVEDFQVKVFFTSLTLATDGDPDGGAGAGDIGFLFGVRTPDSSQGSGLSATLTSVLQSNVELTGDQFSASPTGGLSDVEALLTGGLNNGAGIYGIPLDDGAVLRFPGVLPEAMRSFSFSMTKNDVFAIEGAIVEVDDFSSKYTTAYLGGLEGAQATEAGVTGTVRPVFLGSDLLAANSRFHDLTFTFDGTHNIGVGGGEAIGGNMKMFFIVI